jgi:mono/diheme cytochrome c family protein
MPATEETRYSIKRLHKVFAVASLALLLVTVWLIVDDHTRPWKAIQRQNDQIQSRMATWRSIQYMTQDAQSERDRLQRQLAEVLSQPLSAELWEAFVGEVRADARRRGMEPPPLDELKRLRQRLDDSAATTANLRQRWQQLRLAADKAQLQLEDAMGRDRVQDEAHQQQPDETQQDETVRLQEALRQASTRLQQAADRLAESQARTARHRTDLLDALRQWVRQAEFREEQARDRHQQRQAKLEVARSSYGIAVRQQQPESQLVEMRRQCDRLQAQVTEANRQFEAAAAHREALRDLVRQLTRQATLLRQRLEDRQAELRRLRRVAVESPSRFFRFQNGWPKPGRKWLELPILDAFNSPRAIETLWSEGLQLQLGSFASVRRFDRCTTCHGNSDQTRSGSPGQGRFVPETLVQLELQPPNERPETTERAEQPTRAPTETLEQIYGIRLAGQGLLRATDVAVQWVQPGSAGAQARRLTGVDRQRTGQAVLKQLFHAGGLPLGTAGRTDGLLVGDAIIAIDDQPLAGRPEAVRWVAQRLVQRAAARWEAWEAGDPLPPPVRLTVRRGLPHPFASHPRPDLYVGDASPHPQSQFGCTICHEGQGSATEFRWAAHTPNSPEMRRQWHRQYDWFHNQHWPYPMRPRRFAESACLRCHHQVAELDSSPQWPRAPAPKLVEGHRLVRQLGCFGCHPIDGFGPAGRSIGPDLRLEPPYHAVALQLKGAPGSGYEKLTETERGWIDQLIAHPEQDQVRRQVQQLIVADAQRAAEPDSDSEPPVSQPPQPAADDRDSTGQPADASPTAEPAGPRLFAEAHERLLPLLDDHQYPGKLRKPGPSLRFVAEKLGHRFLYDWIEQPKRFRPDTQMPTVFGLWNHLPDRALRRQRAALLQQQTALAQESGRGAREQQHKLARQLKAIELQLAATESAEQRLEPIEVFSMVTYLRHRSQPYESAPAPEGITAVRSDEDRQRQIERGRVAFQERGCLACHGHDEFEEMEQYRRSQSLNRAPDLSDIADKLGTEQDPRGAGWLYGWIKRPTDYDPRTVMPEMGLDPIQAPEAGGAAGEVTDPIADMVAFLLAESSQNWTVRPDVPVRLDADQQAALNQLAWEYLRGAFRESTARRYVQQGIGQSRRDELQGPGRELLVPDDPASSPSQQQLQQQRVFYVARKSLLKHGCFACHDIPGLEHARPIGVELNDWGRKDPGQLAFHNIVSYLESIQQTASAWSAQAETGLGGEGAGPVNAPQVPEPFYIEQLRLESRIGFIYQKLTEPRSYDYRVAELKGYNERLQMPQFDLSPSQRERIATFVLGLVADPPGPKYLAEAEPRRQAILDGQPIMDKYNCRSCHMTDVERWRITYPPGDYGPQPPPETFPFVQPHFSQQQRAAAHAVDHHNLRQTTLHGLVTIGDDGLPRIMDEEEFPLESDDEYSYRIDKLIYPLDLYKPALIDGHPYQVGGAPLFVPGWQVQRRDEAQGGDLAKYLLPRVVRREKQRNPGAKGSEAWAWLPPPLLNEGAKVQPDWLHRYLLQPTPIRPAVVMDMPRFNLSAGEAAALVDYFAADADASYPYWSGKEQRDEHLREAAERYAQRLRQLAQQQGDEIPPATVLRKRHLADAMKIVTDETYCVKCHIVGDFQPVSSDRAKAPDLAAVGDRLRADYLRHWLARPSSILPYTGMQVNFTYDPDAPDLGATISQQLYHGNSVEQLDAVVDLLLHFDRYLRQQTPVTPLVESAAANEPAAESPSN